jgi:hypothetical protein
VIVVTPSRLAKRHAAAAIENVSFWRPSPWLGAQKSESVSWRGGVGATSRRTTADRADAETSVERLTSLCDRPGSLSTVAPASYHESCRADGSSRRNPPSGRDCLSRLALARPLHCSDRAPYPRPHEPPVVVAPVEHQVGLRGSPGVAELSWNKPQLLRSTISRAARWAMSAEPR